MNGSAYCLLQVSTKTQKYVLLAKLFSLLIVVSHVLGCLYWGLFISNVGDALESDGWIHSSGLDQETGPIAQWVPTLYFALVSRDGRCPFGGTVH